MYYNFSINSHIYSAWIPLFVIPEVAFPQDPLFLTIYITELVFLCITISTTWVYIHLFSKASLVHRNLQMILQFLFTIYYIAIFGRLIILAYQVGFLEITGKPVADMPLLIGCLLRFYLFGLLAISLLSVLLERIFATIYIKDYESRKRTWISITICVAQMIVSTFLVFIVSAKIVNHIGITIIAFCIGLVCVISYAIVLYYNQSCLTKLNMSDAFAAEHYTLSFRFQLTENVKALRVLLRSVYIVCPVGLLMLSPISALRIVEKNVRTTSLFFALFDLFIAMFPHVILIIYMYLIPTVREILRVHVNSILSKKASQKINISRARIDTPAAVNVYFSQINSAWR